MNQAEKLFEMLGVPEKCGVYAGVPFHRWDSNKEDAICRCGDKIRLQNEVIMNTPPERKP